MEANFSQVTNQPVGFVYCQEKMVRHVAYMVDWIEPLLPQMVELMPHQRDRVMAGFQFLQQLPQHRGATVGINIYRGQGIKP